MLEDRTSEATNLVYKLKHFKLSGMVITAGN